MKKVSFLVHIKHLVDQIPRHEKRLTVATLFTIARIVVTPIIVLAMVYARWDIVVYLFLCAGITDIVDGFCARYFNQKTFVGACLDPLADKFLMVSCFITLASINTLCFHLPVWFVLFVLAKECLQIVAVSWLYVYRGYVLIEPTLVAKISTMAQILFILWLSCCCFFQSVCVAAGYCYMFLVVVLMSISCFQYMMIGIPIFNKRLT